jgi:DNA-binding MarR family transcriptional regulator
MLDQIIEKPQLRAVFNLVKEEPGVRFGEIAKKTNLHAPDVAEAIRALKQADVIWATTIPTKGKRVFFSYELAPKGQRLAKNLGDMTNPLVKSKDPDANAAANRLLATRV